MKIKAVASLLALVVAGCAAAPQPRCVPWEARREPESTGGSFGSVPRTASDSELANPCPLSDEDAIDQEPKPLDEPPP